MMTADSPSFGDQVRYQVDRFLSWSPFTRFLGLFALSFGLIVLCALLAKLVMPPSDDASAQFDLFEALWWAMTRVFDTGAMGGDKGTLVRMVAVLATLSGLGVVALLIGLVSSTIGEKLDDLRKGRSPVIDAGHTLILGYGEKVFAILHQLREANSNRPSASIVILSETDKEAVETAVRERMGDMRTTRVVVRQGSPFSVHDLRKVGAGRARSIIALSDESLGHDEGAGAADMGIIKTLLALRRIEGALRDNHVVLELMDVGRRAVVEQLGVGGVEVVAMGDTLSRMMVQTARQNGLAQVYRDLLSYEGSEFYFRAFPELAGKAFSEAQWLMKDAVVCGLRKPGVDGAPAQTLLNPSEFTTIEEGDELLVIAEDDDSFSLTANHQPEVPETFVGAAAVERRPERLLVCGSSPRLGDMLKEFDHYVLPGSEAWLMPGQDKDAFSESIKQQVGSLKNLRLKFVEGDPTMPEALRRIVSPDFGAALVVAETNKTAEEADAHTVITVLLLRDLFAPLGDQAPRIISEILDPRTKELLEQDYGADFVVSSEMTSMLLAQISERRDLNAVFADLFDSDGNEIYLKRAACYAPLGEPTPWLTVQKVARQRSEVAIGYLRPNAAPVINPAQTEQLELTEFDRVIVIAEDDSEAPGDSQAGTLAAPEPVAPPAPQAAQPPPPPPPPQDKPRSALLPPETGKPPETKTITAGPRVAGPSTQPRSPLPFKPKS